MNTTRLRPRYEGANVGTWIGFKHLNYLVEEAVLEHLRGAGLRVTDLYHDHGLCVDLVNIDTRILRALRVDDVAVAEVAANGMSYTVKITTEGDARKAIDARATVALRFDPWGEDVKDTPAELAPYVVKRLGEGGPGERLPEGVTVEDHLTAGRNSFAWKWRIPYFYCHFTERLQMSGYLRLMEEVVDLFLADRGVSVKRLLDEQQLIPAVPHSRITILDEALMEEELYVVLTVEEVFKRLTYTSRMDCYVVRDGVLVRTATGRITHGYARLTGRSEWSLVGLDDRLHDALTNRPS